MILKDPEDRAYAKRLGVDPDNIDELLNANGVMSSDGFASILGQIRADRIEPRHHPHIRDLCVDRSTEMQCAALGLLARAQGPAVLNSCRELLTDQRFRHKASAIHGLTKFGTRDDAPLVIKAAKRHLTNRTAEWVGETPVVEAVVFLERVDEQGDDCRLLTAWLGRRWHLLSNDERSRLSQYAPARIGEPARVLIVSASASCACAALDAASRAFSEFTWECGSTNDETSHLIESIAASDVVIALDADSHRSCLRVQRGDLVRPVIRCDFESADEFSRKFLRQIAAPISDVLAHDASRRLT